MKKMPAKKLSLVFKKLNPGMNLTHTIDDISCIIDSVPLNFKMVYIVTAFDSPYDLAYDSNRALLKRPAE